MTLGRRDRRGIRPHRSHPHQHLEPPDHAQPRNPGEPQSGSASRRSTTPASPHVRITSSLTPCHGPVKDQGQVGAGRRTTDEKCASCGVVENRMDRRRRTKMLVGQRCRPRVRPEGTAADTPTTRTGWRLADCARQTGPVDRGSRPPAIICDVDGTLCDVRSIRHFVERPAEAASFRANFSKFHAASASCPVFPHVRDLVADLALQGFAIIVVTAREARWTELTEQWLDLNGIPRDELITRRELDYRPDAIVKAEICTEIESRYAPALAIDDRDTVLAVWKDASIPTVKVDGEGDLSLIRWGSVPRDHRLDDLIGTARTRRPTQID